MAVTLRQVVEQLEDLRISEWIADALSLQHFRMASKVL